MRSAQAGVTIRNRPALARMNPHSQMRRRSRMRRWHLRRSLVALSFVLALTPLAAHAEDGNQAAIAAARAEKQSLLGLPFMEQHVVFGQREIANARAIARLLAFDSHAQMEIPNSMEQYRALCDMAIRRLQANVTNAAAMVAAK